MQTSPQIVTLLIGLFCLPAVATAQRSKDIITRTQGGMVSGKIESVNADFVTVKEKTKTTKVPVDQISKVRFGDDPTGLAKVRSDVANGQIEQAKKQVAKVKPEGRPLIKQEVDFFKALINSRLALQGQGNITNAAKEMNRFLTANSDSLRYYEACEVMGDLAMNLGKFKSAASYYAKLGKSKSPGIVTRGNLLQGDALLLRGETQQAAKMFQNAARSSDMRLKRLGDVGVAKCQVAAGNHADAVKRLEKIIADNDSKDVELFARAYNALGDAMESAGDSHAALDAYLHTDLLFYGESSQHAEALYHLQKLWSVANKPTEAARARRILKERYAASLWAKK